MTTIKQSDKNKVAILIKRYAEVYQEFEELQEQKIVLAGGDQKTGVTAAYYAKCYIEKCLGQNASSKNPGSSCDLSFTIIELEFKIQVKGISGHSITRAIA